MEIKYGILHNHTEHSLRDSAMTIRQLYDRAKELGAPAIALTDHGILTGIIDFMKMGKEYGIKPIPGIEAYYTPDGKNITSQSKRQHLILMAKDYQGYKAISDANTLSYDYIINQHPCMDMEILRQTFGPESKAHGHIIATSACIAGVLSSILLEDDELVKQTEKLVAKRDKYQPVDNELLDAIWHEESLVNELNELTAKRDELTSQKKTPTTGLKRRLKTLTEGTMEYEEVSQAIADADAFNDNLTKSIADIKKEIAKKKSEKTRFSKSIASVKESADKWCMYNDQLEEALSKKSGIEALTEKAKQTAKEFVEIFGKENFYIELQYHHIPEEAFVMPILAQIAQELNIPTVLANDAHYATNNRDDIRARTIMNALRFKNNDVSQFEMEKGFGELYIKTDEELINTISEVVDRDIVEASLKNIEKIVSECNVEFPVGTHYPVFPMEDTSKTPSQLLRELCEAGIPKRYPNSWNEEYQKRLDYELGIIEKMGFSDYLCIVQDFLNYGRQLGYNCPEGVGYTIGPGRGSAAGSIVCYLSGITSIDPMRYGLIFERFLNPARVSMPDIDADFAKEIREKVIDYVCEKYRSKDPEIAQTGIPICGIITKGTMAAKQAITNVARVTGVPYEIAKELCKMVADNTIDSIPDLDKICESSPVYKQLIDDAKLVEGRISNYGKHAAGIIIADNGNIGDYTPLYKNLNKKDETIWESQLEMAQVEGDAGLLKMDFLGLINLDIISDTLRMIKRLHNITIDIETIPEEPEVLAKIFATGNTDSIFQFESNGMKSQLKQFAPTSLDDLVLLVAAYRPGPMKYIPDIIKTKHGQLTPHYIATGLDEILDNTYGFPIYQEQVMQIFNKVADFSLAEADIVRKAMGKKKIEVLTDPKTNYKGRFIDGLIRHGATKENAEDFWEQLLDFAKYA